jgi:1,4-dihydroxy-2-naphthoyl-CoA hydrolase
MDNRKKLSVDYLNQFAIGLLPNYMGIVVTEIGAGELKAELTIQKHHLAPNGYLHAGSVITLADTTAGYGCYAHLPEGALNFTTIELKSNFLGTARQGVIQCTAKAVHLGRTTQIWDATVVDKMTGKTTALFRCTQLILYPK